MKQTSEMAMDELKAAEKGLGGFTNAGDLPAGRKEPKSKGKKAKKDGACDAPGGAFWGAIMLLAGALALLATAGYGLNYWALLLLVPGLVGLADSARLAQRKRGKSWTVWPLASAAVMAGLGLAWMLELPWGGWAGLALLAAGGALLWLGRLGASEGKK